jgi:hypothetical protein
MIDQMDIEARAFLKEFQQQPEEVRRIFLYAICQTMDQAGLLEFLGAFTTPEVGATLLYRNPDTGEVFEIVKPTMTAEEERAMQAHIGELLQETAQKAV